jgi:hypothetical protein
MKHIKQNLMFAALAALAALAASCSLPFDLPSSAAAEGAGRVVLTVSPGEAGPARTVLPGENQIFSRYELAFSKAGEEVVSPDTSAITGNGVIQELPAGTWTATVSAYNRFTPTDEGEREYLAARGSAQVSVTAGQVAKVTISLEPVMETGVKGIFTYTVTFPSVDTATVTLGSDYSEDLISGRKVSVEVEPGYYDLTITLRNAGGTLIAGAAEKVHIYSGLESEAEYTFDEDFSLLEGSDDKGDSGIDITGTYTATIGGAGATLTVTPTGWSLSGPANMTGTYILNGTSATLSSGGVTFGTAVLSGNTLTVTSSASGSMETYTFTRSDGNGGNGNNGGKPAELSSNATFGETIAKLDEIIAYTGTPEAIKTEAQNAKDSLKSFEDTLKPTWSYSGISYIYLTNTIINALPETDDGDNNDDGNIDGKTLVITDIDATLAAQGQYGTIIIGIFPVGTTPEEALSGVGVVAGANNDEGVITLSPGPAPYTATVELLTRPNGTSRWTGSGTYDVYLGLVSEITANYYRKQNVSFTSASTSVSAADFSPVSPGEAIEGYGFTITGYDGGVAMVYVVESDPANSMAALLATSTTSFIGVILPGINVNTVNWENTNTPPAGTYTILVNTGDSFSKITEVFIDSDGSGSAAWNNRIVLVEM